jgi:hypothetical protein
MVHGPHPADPDRQNHRRGLRPSRLAISTALLLRKVHPLAFRVAVRLLLAGVLVGSGGGQLTACAQVERSVSLPAAIVLGWEVFGKRGGDLDEAAPRGGQQLRRAVDDTAGPQMPVERHLDHHLTV